MPGTLSISIPNSGTDLYTSEEAAAFQFKIVDEIYNSRVLWIVLLDTVGLDPCPAKDNPRTGRYVKDLQTPLRRGLLIG